VSIGDIALLAGPERMDVQVSANDLLLDSGLKTAVTLSLFTDQRATTLELPPGEASRRGWWGDALAEIDGDKYGSKLWLLSREKQTQEVAERAKEYCLEALQWLIDDGIAAAITISTDISVRGILGIEIEIRRPSGDSSTFEFDYVWQATAVG